MTRLTRSTHPSSLSLTHSLNAPLTRLFCPLPPPTQGSPVAQETVPIVLLTKGAEAFLPPGRWSPPPRALTSSNPALLPLPPPPWWCITRRHGTELGNLENWNGSRGKRRIKGGERERNAGKRGWRREGRGWWWEERWLGGIYKRAKHRPVGHGGLLCQQFISHSVLAVDSEPSLKANYCSIRKVHTATPGCIHSLDWDVLIFHITTILIWFQTCWIIW